ncbi:unnamed protein product [Chondrus crispus]|uniref:thioredoxin-dependent peroxiredoxin n=1 Tax=Chondrus crispus TaxID=2769 RepID=R7QGR8_CHOCR|nr:unnamed protein product [Chondrus crispus]CDF37712.1 unnamed protein product [Chondrus crispus]|eukprot:XP_005717583.1 unnamed protein product [Chondrus crispus]
MSVTVGSPAVDFSLPTSGGGTLSAADLQAKAEFVIIYFYPRDATPGCTTEAKDFRDLAPQLEQLNATVVGVSRDSVESHDAFVKDLDLNFPLITDDGTLTEGYGVWKLRKLGDKEMMIVERSTFILRGGKVVKEWRGVKSTGHAAAVVESLKSL